MSEFMELKNTTRATLFAFAACILFGVFVGLMAGERNGFAAFSVTSCVVCVARVIHELLA